MTTQQLAKIIYKRKSARRLRGFRFRFRLCEPVSGLFTRAWLYGGRRFLLTGFACAVHLTVCECVRASVSGKVFARLLRYCVFGHALECSVSNHGMAFFSLKPVPMSLGKYVFLLL